MFLFLLKQHNIVPAIFVSIAVNDKYMLGIRESFKINIIC